MKEEKLYTFYSDEDVGKYLSDLLHINPKSEMKDHMTEDGNYELFGSDNESGESFSQQLMKSQWSEIGIGRHTVLFYLKYHMGEEIAVQSVEKVHVIVRHETKNEIREKCEDDVQKALTILNDNDTL